MSAPTRKRLRSVLLGMLVIGLKVMIFEVIMRLLSWLRVDRVVAMVPAVARGLCRLLAIRAVLRLRVLSWLVLWLSRASPVFLVVNRSSTGVLSLLAVLMMRIE